MKFSILGLISLLSLASCWEPSVELGFHDLGFPHTMQVHDDMWISWQAHDLKEGQTEKDQVLTIAIAANTEAWIAFGISETGGMRGADICVIREDNGVFRPFDMHSIDYTSPIMDDVQDWALLRSNQANGETMHIIERVADICHEDFHDMPLKDLEQRFIFAFGFSPAFGYHGVEQRTTMFINMFDDDPPLGPPDLPSFEVYLPGHLVPTDTDSFMCSNMTFPIDQSQEYHIVAVEPLIDNPFAHHIITNACIDLPDLPGNQTPEGSWSCPSMGLAGCSMYSLGWSVGQRISYLPDNIGIPLGKGRALHMILQMHSNNPNHVAGYRDRSGFRVYYTTELREFDTSGITTGLSASSRAIALPPQQPNINLVSECPESCLERSTGPVIVYQINWHMHETGKSVYLSHIRDGVEIRRLGINYWDYNWQGYHKYEEFEVLPTDRLVTHCNFDTSNRTDYTYGGEGTQDEMCFVWIGVYQNPGIGFCTGINRFEVDGYFRTACQGGLPTLQFRDYEEIGVCENNWLRG